jgi:Fe-S cluster biogenesis protein NfuA
MFIQTETTPNPHTLKFLPGEIVLQNGTADFRSAEEATRSPFAQRLFRLNGVQGIMYGRDFVSVTKSDTKDWAVLKPLILGMIMDHFSQADPKLFEDENETQIAHGDADLSNPVIKQIVDLLDKRIRPAVAQDGGDIQFVDFQDGIVMLQMRGACAGCPSSTLTLKSGIENMLRHYVPEVIEVRAVNA